MNFISRQRITLLIETASNYGRNILRGVRSYMRSHQAWTVYLEQRELSSQSPAWLANWEGEGLLSRCSDQALFEKVLASGLPMIDLTDRFGVPPGPYVWSDDQKISQLAANHLAERGFQHFAFCGYTGEYWSQSRRDSFCQAIEQLGGTCAVYESPWFGTTKATWEEELSDLIAWLQTLPLPVGIMACNDLRGKEVLDGCTKSGFMVPEEVAVIGVDNDEILCELGDPPMSSVIPNAEGVGYLACELLDRLMQGETIEQARHLVPPLGIATRQSTDILAIDDPEVAAALKYIRENACQGATVASILKVVPISRSILERRFRKHLRRSPQAILREVQLKRVQELLRETELPLIKISELAGFRHVEHMCVVFKRELGQTPGNYRKQAGMNRG
ncbi:Helix-turn-helix-domain containing protein AraC type [Planctomycetales bacterium 10988]|nr:Helix-turn-helix-domain containing protein AraC type [Planctomycetales bacterium 10988]